VQHEPSGRAKTRGANGWEEGQLLDAFFLIWKLSNGRHTHRIINLKTSRSGQVGEGQKCLEWNKMFLLLSTRGLWLTWPTSSGMEGSGSLPFSAALPTFCRWIRPLTDWIRRKRSSFVNPPLLGALLFSSSRHLIRWPTSEMPVRTLRDYIALRIYISATSLSARMS